MAKKIKKNNEEEFPAALGIIMIPFAMFGAFTGMLYAADGIEAVVNAVSTSKSNATEVEHLNMRVQMLEEERSADRTFYYKSNKTSYWEAMPKDAHTYHFETENSKSI